MAQLKGGSAGGALIYTTANLITPSPDVIITHQATTVTISAGGASDTIDAATATLAGIVTNTTQTFAGAKTFANTTASTSTTTGAVKIAGGLGVQGDIHANKVYGAVYNDVAEFMYHNVPSKPGMVMVTRNGKVQPSSGYGQKTVVGVHSDTFGYGLGSADKDLKTPIGLTGRVNVWVNEKLKEGDLLISGVNGFAAKKRFYDLRKGIVLGKVMQNKNNSTPERVEMIIMLS